MEKIFKPITNTRTIIGKLIDDIFKDREYQDKLNELRQEDSNKVSRIENTFNSIVVFQCDNSSEPLFLARDIGILMGVSNLSARLKDFTDEEKVTGILKGTDSRREADFLTRYGIYRLAFTSRNAIGEIFKKFLYKVIDYMLVYQKDNIKQIISEIQRDNPELLQEASKDISQNYKVYEELYLREKKIHEETKRLLIDNEVEVINNDFQIAQLKKDLQDFQQKLLINNKELDEELENTYLAELKRRYMRPFNIYIVCPDTVNKSIKSNKNYNKDDNKEDNIILDQYDKTFKILKAFKQKYNSVDKTELIYIYLNDTKKIIEDERFVYLGTEYTHNKETYAKFLNALSKDEQSYQLPGTKTQNSLFYKTTYTYIELLAEQFIKESDQS